MTKVKKYIVLLRICRKQAQRKEFWGFCIWLVKMTLELIYADMVCVPMYAITCATFRPKYFFNIKLNIYIVRILS